MEKPQTTVEFLDAIKAKYGLKSNYALAKKMGQTDTAIARWMHGKNTLADESAMHVAELLEIDPAYVMACCHAEREKNAEVKATWQKIAQRMAVAAAVLVFVGAPIILSSPDNTIFAGLSDGYDIDNNIHYAKYTAAALILTVWQYRYVFLPLIAFLLWAFYPKIPRSKNN